MVKASFNHCVPDQLTSALRLPVSSGLIVAALTTEDPGARNLACDILRDLMCLSIVNTSTWAVITIMFRSGSLSMVNIQLYNQD